MTTEVSANNIKKTAKGGKGKFLLLIIPRKDCGVKEAFIWVKP